MTITRTPMSLAVAADGLRALHVPGDPLVLLNVWDVASALEVAAAGVAALGTSSAAVDAMLGESDDDTMPVVAAFGAIARITAAVSVPVTADVEASYGLPADELVGALIDAGAVGCNLEDSDHRRPGALVDVDDAAAKLGAVRAAGRAAGVDLVVNARIDVLRHGGGDREAALAEIVLRGQRYIEAGADCVFPVGVVDPATVERLVASIAAPINVGLPPGGRIADLATAGASRLSMGPTLHRLAMADLRQRAADVLATARPSGPSQR